MDIRRRVSKVLFAMSTGLFGYATALFAETDHLVAAVLSFLFCFATATSYALLRRRP